MNKPDTLFSIYSPFPLSPCITFLNHGSYGACPTPILAKQSSLRLQLETEPLRFFLREHEPLLDSALDALAKITGAATENICFIPNATTGVNTVLRNLKFNKDDELLTTNFEYNACKNALQFTAEQFGAKVITAEIPFPLNSKEEIIKALSEKISKKTKLLLVDDISSQTSVIFPLKEIIALCKAHEIEILVDGAHRLGMLDLDLKSLGATYYTGNCHKWLCAPKGTAFLYVDSSKIDGFRPLVISHGANSTRKDRSKFHLEHDWLGTHDPSSYLCLEATIAFLESLVPGGLKELKKQNHQKALAGRKILSDKLGFKYTCPEDMLGSMVSFILPDKFKSEDFLKIHDRLFDEFNIEVQVMPGIDLPAKIKSPAILRISAHVYNAVEQYEYLADSLLKL